MHRESGTWSEVYTPASAVLTERSEERDIETEAQQAGSNGA